MKVIKTITPPDKGYNGSLLRIDNKYLFVYRHEQKIGWSPFYISACWLDLNYNIISKPHLLLEGGYDPRIIQKYDRIYMTYTDHHNVHLGEITINGDNINYKNDHILQADFKLSNTEKNWLPFVSEELYFVYSFNPHIILKCDINHNYSAIKNMKLSTH